MLSCIAGCWHQSTSFGGSPQSFEFVGTAESIIVGDEAAATGFRWSEDKYLHDFFGHVCSCCHIMLLMTLLFPYLNLFWCPLASD